MAAKYKLTMNERMYVDKRYYGENCETTSGIQIKKAVPKRCDSAASLSPLFITGSSSFAQRASSKGQEKDFE